MKKLFTFLLLSFLTFTAYSQCADFDDTTFDVTAYGDTLNNPGVAIDLDPVTGATAYQAFFIPVRWTADSSIAAINAKINKSCGAWYSDVFPDTMLYISLAWNFNGAPGDEYYVYVTATGSGISGCRSNVFRVTAPQPEDYTNPYTQTPGTSLPCTTVQTKARQDQYVNPREYPIRKSVR